MNDARVVDCSYVQARASCFHFYYVQLLAVDCDVRLPASYRNGDNGK